MRRPIAKKRRCWAWAALLICGRSLGVEHAAPQTGLPTAEPWTAPPQVVTFTDDVQASAEFLQTQLGFRLISRDNERVVLRSGALNIALADKTRQQAGGIAYVEYFVQPAISLHDSIDTGDGIPMSMKPVGKTQQLTEPTGLVWMRSPHSPRTVRVAIDRLGGRLAKKIPAGSITVKETSFGLVFEPKLSGMPPGMHSFHLHENPSCEGEEIDGVWIPGAAAGGHYDPGLTGFHGHPYGYGHLGDLPDLYVNHRGDATMPLLAPRLAFEDLTGRSLMIHADGEHDPTHHAAMGVNPRMACGVVSSACQSVRCSGGPPK